MGTSVTGGSSEGSGPEAVVGRFLDALLWSEHLTVWELLGPEGREHALAAATRGLDAVTAERIRQGTASARETDTVLGALVQGLRVDLDAGDLASLRPRLDAPDAPDAPEAPGDEDGRHGDEVRVEILMPSTLPLTLPGDGPGAPGWLVATAVLRWTATPSEPGPRWRIERVEPRRARRA